MDKWIPFPAVKPKTKTLYLCAVYGSRKCKDGYMYRLCEWSSTNEFWEFLNYDGEVKFYSDLPDLPNLCDELDLINVIFDNNQTLEQTTERNQ